MYYRIVCREYGGTVSKLAGASSPSATLSSLHGMIEEKGHGLALAEE